MSPEDGAGGDGDMVHVAMDEGGAVLPTELAERGKVRDEMEVPVAKLPVGKLVAGHGVHFHVRGQKVIAGVRAFACNGFEKEIRVEAFAHHPAVVVGECGNDRVDASSLDVFG